MAVDLEIFDKLEEADGASVGTVELAKAAGADVSLIGTLLVFSFPISVYYLLLALGTEQIYSSDYEASLRHVHRDGNSNRPIRFNSVFKRIDDPKISRRTKLSVDKPLYWNYSIFNLDEVSMLQVLHSKEYMHT